MSSGTELWFAKTPTAFAINNIAFVVSTSVRVELFAMFRFLGVCFATLVRLFRSRQNLFLENLALRQQVSVLKRRHPHSRLYLLDRLFWLLVPRFWSGWKQALLLVTPETVVRWHRAAFRWY